MRPLLMPAAPALPLWLGGAGLLPFWILAVGRVTGIGFGLTAATLSLALACYAATILSFLGGIRWGLALVDPASRRADFVVSVLPQLGGWAALALPDPLRLLVLAALILLLGPLDWTLVRRGHAPPWFGDLRVRLSIGAGAALVVAALA